MGDREPFYFGNAKADQVPGTGWFVGQFIPAEFGLRHQTDVELKWGVHPDGEKRPRPWANQNGTTISVLIEGSLKITFHVDGAQQEVTLRTKGRLRGFRARGCPLLGGRWRYDRSLCALSISRGRITNGIGLRDCLKSAAA